MCVLLPVIQLPNYRLYSAPSAHLRTRTAPYQHRAFTTHTFLQLPHSAICYTFIHGFVGWIRLRARTAACTLRCTTHWLLPSCAHCDYAFCTHGWIGFPFLRTLLFAHCLLPILLLRVATVIFFIARTCARFTGFTPSLQLRTAMPSAVSPAIDHQVVGHMHCALPLLTTDAYRLPVRGCDLYGLRLLHTHHVCAGHTFRTTTPPATVISFLTGWIYIFASHHSFPPTRCTHLLSLAYTPSPIISHHICHAFCTHTFFFFFFARFLRFCVWFIYFAYPLLHMPCLASAFWCHAMPCTSYALHSSYLISPLHVDT